MKYIDPEKLIAEIDKILAKAEKDEKKAFYKKDAAGHLIAVTKTAICARVKKSIASLQQAQPKADIEKEYAEFVDADPVYSKLVNGVVGKSIARHFYELGLNTRKV